MADITASCTIKGAHQHTELPFQWHVWEIDVPAGAFGSAGADDILLPDRFDSNTYLVDAFVQIPTAFTNGSGTTVLDVETGLITIGSEDAGDVTGKANIATELAGINLETANQTIQIGTFGAALTAFGSGVTDGTNHRVINLEVTTATAVPTVGGVILFGALLGRVTV